MKKVRLIVIIIMVLALCLTAGCKTEEITEISDAPVSCSLIHGNPSGTWFMLGNAIAESVSKSYPGSVIQATPGQSYANLIQINENSAEFALTHSSKGFEAVNGIGQYEEPLTNIGGIAIFYPSIAHFAIKESVDISSFNDFIERKVPITISIGSNGGNAQIAFNSILSYYGLTVEDLEDWGCKIFVKGFSDSKEMFADGAIDGMFVVAGAPASVITSMGTNADMKMIPIDQEIIDVMVNDFGYDYYTFPGGAYNFADEDMGSFANYTMLMASLQTSDEVAYKLTKSINENLDYIGTVHAALSGITSDDLLRGMNIPLHPGAEKYYKEVGLID